MVPKHAATFKASGTQLKWQRKVMTIAEKVKLPDMLKAGTSFAALGCHYGISESTVHYIKKDEKKIRQTASISFNKEVKKVVTSGNKTIVKMQTALALWIADCRKKNIEIPK